MGRASKWFRSVFGLKKSDPIQNPAKKWSFSIMFSRKADRDRYRQKPPPNDAVVSNDRNDAVAPVSKHSIIGRRGIQGKGRVYGFGVREERASVIIQSYFRAYLARRALRALKALVKLQALVRGHIMRKNTANYMRQIQAVARAQARARAARHSLSSHSNNKKDAVSASPEKMKQVVKAQSVKRFHMDDAKNNAGSWKPRGIHRQRNICHSSDLSHCSDQYCQSFSTSSTARQTSISGEVHSFSTLKQGQDAEESAFYTPNSSPQFYSASPLGRRELTPSGYSDHHPNYMAYTESSKAKVRSFSAPRQRPYSMDINESRTDSRKVPSSTLHANFTNKAYPGSGRL